MYRGNRNGKKDRPMFTSTRLLDQLRERLRYLHYSLQTEKNYVYWVRWFIRWHGVRHPKDMGGKEVEAFLSMLADEAQHFIGLALCICPLAPSRCVPVRV